MTALMARRILAGALLGVVMTLSLAGIASAQSNSGSNSASNSSTGSAGSSAGGAAGGAAGGTTTGRTAGSTARTGAEMWIPLMLGGLVITVAVATRVGLTRAASRIP